MNDLKSSLDMANVTDVAIVGGGPAGLSAALLLARCCRNVVVYDTHSPRNACSRKLHGFLTRESMPPSEFLRLAREEVQKYPTVGFRSDQVLTIKRAGNTFEVVTASGDRAVARRILLATGVVDELPPIPAVEDFYGKTIFQCPYCDGWEFRGQPLAVYGQGERGLKLAKTMTAWSKQLILFTDGSRDLSLKDRSFLFRNNIHLEEDKIALLSGQEGILTEIALENGKRFPVSAMFFNMPSQIKSDLVTGLGCSFSEKEGVYTSQYESTGVSGVFAAGNILRDVQLAIVAAAEGARAAFGINRELTEEDLGEGWANRSKQIAQAV